MATVKITELPAATTPLTGDEVMPIVQGGVTKQTPVNSTLSLNFILQSSVNVVRLLADGSFSPSAITFSAFQDNGVGVRVAYAGRFVISTSTDGVTYAVQYTSTSNESTKTYTVPAGVTFVRCQLYKADNFGSLIQQVVVSVIRDGTDGSSGSGTDAVVVNLSKAAATVFAYADGTVPSFADIDGQVTVFKGAANETASATFAVAGSGLTGQINTAVDTPVVGKPKGYYRVTAMSADIGSLVITTSFEGQDYVRSFSVSKVRTGYEIVNSLPVTNLFQGRMVFLTTDNKLYRYTGTEWTAAVATSDLTGQIVQAQVADGAINTAKFAASIEPVTLVSSVPGTKSTNSIFNTTDGFMYRWNGSAYVKTLPTTDLTGTITNAQIDAVAASKVTGQLTNSQLQDIAATKVTGTITNTQIADDAITSPKIFAGAITTAKIAANAVTANEIASNAITAVKIQAGAIETAKIAAGAVTASQIAANTITASQIAANTITASQIASDTITAGQIAAGAISTDELAANAVTAAKIAAGTITANEIAANTITAAKIQAFTITANELASNSITADKIGAGEVTAAKINVTNLAAMSAQTGTLSVNGTLTLGTSGKIITSGTGYDQNGIFLGEDGAGVYKFSVGGSSGRLAFDGTNLSLPGGRLVNGSVGGSAIAASAITADKISVSSLSAISADFGNMTAGAIDLTAGSYVVRHGAGFGASSDLVLWYGLASVARGSATKTNGLFALATDGKVYLGSSTLETLTTPMTATMTTDYSTTHSTNITPTIDVSPAVSNIQNGTAPYTYRWAIVNMEEGTAPVITNGTSAQCNIYRGATLGAAQSYVGTASCTITDANSKQLIKYFNFADYSTV